MRSELAVVVILLTSACAPEWTLHRDVEGGFNVLLPTSFPDREVLDIDSFFGPDAAIRLDIAEVHTITVSVLADQGMLSRMTGINRHRSMGVYRVFFADLPISEHSLDEAGVLERFRDLTVNRFRSNEGSGETPICSRELVRESILDEHFPAGLEFWYEQACTDDAPLVVTVRSQILVSEGRLYGLEVRGPKADTHSQLTFEEASSEDAEAFFASFEIDR